MCKVKVKVREKLQGSNTTRLPPVTQRAVRKAQRGAGARRGDDMKRKKHITRGDELMKWKGERRGLLYVEAKAVQTIQLDWNSWIV